MPIDSPRRSGGTACAAIVEPSTVSTAKPAPRTAETTAIQRDVVAEQVERRRAPPSPPARPPAPGRCPAGRPAPAPPPGRAPSRRGRPSSPTPAAVSPLPTLGSVRGQRRQQSASSWEARARLSANSEPARRGSRHSDATALHRRHAPGPPIRQRRPLRSAHGLSRPASRRPPPSWSWGSRVRQDERRAGSSPGSWAGSTSRATTCTRRPTSRRWPPAPRWTTRTAGRGCAGSPRWIGEHEAAGDLAGPHLLGAQAQLPRPAPRRAPVGLVRPRRPSPDEVLAERLAAAAGALHAAVPAGQPDGHPGAAGR